MTSIKLHLTFEGELLVKKGDKVEFQTPLYKQFSKEDIIVPLAKILSTSSSKIFQSLKKFVGEKLTKGDLVAESSSLLTKKKYFSEYDGILKEVNHQEGTILIEINTDQETTVKSFFAGEVAEIKDIAGDLSPEAEGNKTEQKLEITIHVKHSKEYSLKDASQSFGGEAVYCSDPIKDQLTEDDVSEKIVVDEQIPAYEQVKYEALGAKAFVSLHVLPEKSFSFYATLAEESDYEKLSAHKLPYCLINKEESKIYFYE